MAFTAAAGEREAERDFRWGLSARPGAHVAVHDARAAVEAAANLHSASGFLYASGEVSDTFDRAMP